MNTIRQLIASLPIYIWLAVLLALAISSIYQGIQSRRRKSAWSISAQPASRRLAIWVRLVGGTLLLVPTLFSIWSEILSSFRGVITFYRFPRILTIDSILGNLFIVGIFLCLIPINAFRLSFDSRSQYSNPALMLRMVVALALLLIVSINYSMTTMLVNTAVDGIYIAMGGPQMYFDDGPYIIQDFKQTAVHYDWNQQYHLIPVAAVTYAIALIGLFSVVQLAHLDRQQFRGRKIIQSLLITTTLYGFLALSILEFWPRTNPFIFAGMGFGSGWYGLSMIVKSAAAGAAVAWMCSYRETENYSLAPVADPFESLTQPKLLLYAFVGAWLLIAFMTGWPNDVSFYAWIIIVVGQLFEGFSHRRGSLQAIMTVNQPIFFRNWILFAATLPAIAMLLPLLPTLLLSMSK